MGQFTTVCGSRGHRYTMKRETEGEGVRDDGARGWKVGSGRAENNATCRITNYTLQEH